MSGRGILRGWLGLMIIVSPITASAAIECGPAPTLACMEERLRGLDRELRELDREEAKRAAEWERNQAAIAAAKQAEFDRKLARKCNSVRSDQATPALLVQCERLLGR